MTSHLMSQRDSSRWFTSCPWTLRLAILMLLFNLGLFFSSTSVVEKLLTGLQYDRSAILNGQLWRLLTGNLIHWSAEHFLLDVGSFLFFGFLYERAFGKSYLWMLLTTGLLVTISALVVLPGMATYRGLSGVDSGLFAAVLCLEYRLISQKRGEWILLVFATGIFVLKLGYECLTGQMFLRTESLGDLGQPVPLAHIAGAVGAVAFFEMRNVLWIRGSTLQVCPASKVHSHQSCTEIDLVRFDNNSNSAERIVSDVVSRNSH